MTTTQTPVHPATIQLHRRLKGGDVTEPFMRATAPQAVLAIQGSWRDGAAYVISATVRGVFVTVSELREQVREEQHAAALR